MAGLKLKPGSLENLPKAAKVVIGVVVVSLAAIIYVTVFYSEIESDITAARDTLAAKNRELDEAKKADLAYNKDLTELERRRQLAQKQKTILPDESETPAFLSSIQTVATIAGVKLTSWTPQDEKREAYYAKVPMELKLKGKYHQIAKFFHGIGQVDRIINMENIILNIAKKKEKNVVSDENIQVEVQCLATAFRAVKNANTAKGGRRGAKKRAKAK